ncbi:flagellar biosynthetic protein FliR [Pantoea coffeiphila]|uniref:Flagellar biosynthetic protein FliR n=1 Tax=Pantoea coffeiphila TaxID=1465635 RepID=A0A2S9IHS0_9GAMM|nr:flagellar biosynthetic protein FliR [Pantoea coffeiphila]PRD17327.1 flagellar biosynthetic protein FliR [Pantoea coffeiphila]
MGIPIHQLLDPLLALWLPFVRIAAFFHFCPIFEHRAFPRKAKVGLALLLSILIVPMLDNNVVLHELMTMQTLLLSGEQILWGLLFGQMLNWVFSALQTAGAILSMNMGLGMAVMNDPGSGNSTMVISQIVFVFSVLLFFSMDGHLLLITILHKGFAYWPIGQAINALTLRTAATGVGWLLTGALLLALPTVFIMLLVQGAFGLLNRISPTLNLFALGFPISMLFGLFCLTLLSGSIPDHYLSLTNQILAQFDQLRSH